MVGGLGVLDPENEFRMTMCESRIVPIVGAMDGELDWVFLIW